MEFWGCLKMDSLKELSWPEGYTKDEIRPLVEEANALGMEIIPFFQHLGHAALSRMGYSGKHVVLDQNLELDYLYYPKSRGWVGIFMSDAVRKLLRSIRRELIDLCGDGEYFHLGCDESGLDFNTDDLCAWNDPAYDCWFGSIAERSYNMYRRVSSRGQSYEDCGWSKNQIE
jgi:hypothetical protein